MEAVRADQIFAAELQRWPDLKCSGWTVLSPEWVGFARNPTYRATIRMQEVIYNGDWFDVATEESFISVTHHEFKHLYDKQHKGYLHFLTEEESRRAHVFGDNPREGEAYVIGAAMKERVWASYQPAEIMERCVAWLREIGFDTPDYMNPQEDPVWHPPQPRLEFSTREVIVAARHVNQPYFLAAPNTVQESIMNYWPLDLWEGAAGVSFLESGWDHKAHCHDCFVMDEQGNYKKGPPAPGWTVVPEDSRGLFQINVDAWPNFSPDLLFDVAYNVAAAHEVYTIQGWGAWKLASEKLGLT